MQEEPIEPMWDHLIESGWLLELTPEQQTELDRRYEEHRANPTNVLTWEQIVEYVRRSR